MATHTFPLSPLALAALALGAGAIPAHAAPVDVPTVTLDQQAASAAHRDLQGALSQLSARRLGAARDRLERAETVLLNRESLELGATLKPDQPLPKTPLMAEIDSARAALAAHDSAGARRAANDADREIGAELGSATPGAANGTV